MNRCCNGLLVAFRVLQFLLSLVALGCASYILSQMIALSDYAQDLEITIGQAVNATTPVGSDDDLETFNKGMQAIQTIFTPILQFVQGTPARSVSLVVVSAWSVGVIIYMFVAQRRGYKNRDKASHANKRWARVTLELITLFAWSAGIVCAVLLALQFGAMAILGGGPPGILIKGAIKRIIFNQVLDSNDNGNKKGNGNTGDNDDHAFAQAMELFDTLVHIGIASILAAAASVVCGLVSLISVIVACCISGKARKSEAKSEKSVYRGENDYLVHGQPIAVSPMSPPAPYSPHGPYSPKSNITSVTVVQPPTPTHW